MNATIGAGIIAAICKGRKGGAIIASGAGGISTGCIGGKLGATIFLGGGTSVIPFTYSYGKSSVNLIRI
jgi:hypothetical protein